MEVENLALLSLSKDLLTRLNLKRSITVDWAFIFLEDFEILRQPYLKMLNHYLFLLGGGK
jgi:hypothetical protein